MRDRAGHIQMRRLYIRWVAITAAALAVAILGELRYEKEVTTITPEQLLTEQPSGTVRVLGWIKPDSLSAPQGNPPSFTAATFDLMGEEKEIAVRYEGEAAENLRELKKIVVIGRWDPTAGEFSAHETANLPNYGYVASAYLLVLIPLGLFLFRMERRVELLYTEIRTAKAYEPEVNDRDEG